MMQVIALHACANQARSEQDYLMCIYNDQLCASLHTKHLRIKKLSTAFATKGMWWHVPVALLVWHVIVILCATHIGTCSCKQISGVEQIYMKLSFATLPIPAGTVSLMVH